MQILVIDDDPVIQQLLRAVLAPQASQLDVVGGGEDGLRIARTAMPDLVIVDAMMPEMDGFELCRRLRELPGRRPWVILLTAAAATADAGRVSDAGIDEVMPKPFSPATLMERVGDIASRR